MKYDTTVFKNIVLAGILTTTGCVTPYLGTDSKSFEQLTQATPGQTTEAVQQTGSSAIQLTAATEEITPRKKQLPPFAKYLGGFFGKKAEPVTEQVAAEPTQTTESSATEKQTSNSTEVKAAEVKTLNQISTPKAKPNVQTAKPNPSIVKNPAQAVPNKPVSTTPVQKSDKAISSFVSKVKKTPVQKIHQKPQPQIAKPKPVATAQAPAVKTRTLPSGNVVPVDSEPKYTTATRVTNQPTHERIPSDSELDLFTSKIYETDSGSVTLEIHNNRSGSLTETLQSVLKNVNAPSPTIVKGPKTTSPEPVVTTPLPQSTTTNQAVAKSNLPRIKRQVKVIVPTHNPLRSKPLTTFPARKVEVAENKKVELEPVVSQPIPQVKSIKIEKVEPAKTAETNTQSVDSSKVVTKEIHTGSSILDSLKHTRKEIATDKAIQTSPEPTVSPKSVASATPQQPVVNKSRPTIKMVNPPAQTNPAKPSFGMVKRVDPAPIEIVESPRVFLSMKESKEPLVIENPTIKPKESLTYLAEPKIKMVEPVKPSQSYLANSNPPLPKNPVKKETAPKIVANPTVKEELVKSTPRNATQDKKPLPSFISFFTGKKIKPIPKPDEPNIRHTPSKPEVQVASNPLPPVVKAQEYQNNAPQKPERKGTPVYVISSD